MIDGNPHHTITAVATHQNVMVYIAIIRLVVIVVVTAEAVAEAVLAAVLVVVNDLHDHIDTAIMNIAETNIVRRGVRAKTEIEVGIDIEEGEVIAETGEIEPMRAVVVVMIMKGKEDMTTIENLIEEGVGVLERMYRV